MKDQKIMDIKVDQRLLILYINITILTILLSAMSLNSNKKLKEI